MTYIISPHTEAGCSSAEGPLLQERVASVLGYRMAYVAGGEGEPLILLHGLGHASSAWNGVLPLLARRFKVFAVDMLGCGRSDKPRIDYHLWSMASYLRFFMDAVGIRRAHLMGHSLGGGIAMQTKFQYPERVDRLALISSGGFGRELRLLLRIPTIPGGSAIMTVVTRPFWDRVIKLLGYREPTTLLKIETRKQWLNLAQPDHRWAFMGMLRGVSNITGQTVSALDRLHLLQSPVLLVWGDHDRTIPVAHAKRAAKLIPNCQLEILHGCGHYPALQCPEEVAGLVERFLLASAPALATQAAQLAELERANHRKVLMEQAGELSSGIA
jgi:pimeloyl-ACP methyl ester carboxylesterase